jgi:hypothetical protein
VAPLCCARGDFFADAGEHRNGCSAIERPSSGETTAADKRRAGRHGIVTSLHLRRCILVASSRRRVVSSFRRFVVSSFRRCNDASLRWRVGHRGFIASSHPPAAQMASTSTSTAHRSPRSVQREQRSFAIDLTPAQKCGLRTASRPTRG